MSAASPDLIYAIISPLSVADFHQKWKVPEKFAEVQIEILQYLQMRLASMLAVFQNITLRSKYHVEVWPHCRHAAL